MKTKRILIQKKAISEKIHMNNMKLSLQLQESFESTFSKDIDSKMFQCNHCIKITKANHHMQVHITNHMGRKYSLVLDEVFEIKTKCIVHKVVF